VKPAASTDKQSESRAAHVTVKATSVSLVPEREGDLRGVRGAARVQGGVRNTRGPSALPGSGRGGSYKPKVKSSAVQRESEGVVVPSIVATNNAAGGKGPWGGRVDEVGKREGMAGRTGPNHPDRREPIDKARQLQHRLWAVAKRQPGVRFHALRYRIWRGDVLQGAWKRVHLEAA
jgi:hypothetical protein